jgi:uncharacterized protein (DUF4415 family)
MDEINAALEAPLSAGKVRVNTWIDADVYFALLEEAKQSGGKYQTLLNKYLRAAVLQEVSPADLKAIKIALGKKASA